jgi:hypothetical protein
MVNVNQKFINKINRSSAYGKDCLKTTQGSSNHENSNNNLLENSDNHKKQVFKIYHQNICGLQLKMDELVASLYPDLPDILCISEHHLKSMQIQLILSEEYNLCTEFCRQSFHKGGVCMYILKRFSFSVINLTEHCRDKDLEACAVKLKLSLMTICFLTVYRSPSGNYRFF